MKKIFVLVFTIISANNLFAQNIDSVKVKPPKISPPVPVEIFAGNNGLVFQMIVSKHFSPKSRFGFFNVSSFTGDYASQNQKNSYLSQAFITADIWNLEGAICKCRCYYALQEWVSSNCGTTICHCQ